MKQTMVLMITKDPKLGNPPLVLNPEYGYGIMSKGAAMEWGRTRGYAVVYYWHSRGRVYAENVTKQVNVLAKKLEQASADLVVTAEAAPCAYRNSKTDKGELPCLRNQL